MCNAGDATTAKLKAYSNDFTHAVKTSTTSADVVGVPASSGISAATSSRHVHATTFPDDRW